MNIWNKDILNSLTVRLLLRGLSNQPSSPQICNHDAIKICNKDLDDRTAGPFYPTKIRK